MKYTKVAVIKTKTELDDFLWDHDVLSVQFSHTIEDQEFGKRHYTQGIWVVWYKED